MQFVELGASGLRISRLGIGTAAFGLGNYGIPTPGEDAIPEASAIATIEAAVASGVNFFDTAPGYGSSEDLLGRTLQRYPNTIIATKVAIPEGIDSLSKRELQRIVDESLDASRRALRRDVLDMVQIHNATVTVLWDGHLVDCLEQAREQGKLRCIGASVYGPGTALEALKVKQIAVLQLAVSLLDQRMCGRVLPVAEKANVGVLTRSAFLKGALTRRAQWLPESLRPVAEASSRAVRLLNTSWDDLPSIALRFCLSLAPAHSVLVGIRSPEELVACVAAEDMGPLASDMQKIAYSLALDDEQLLDPSFWRLEESDVEHEPA